MMSAVLSAFVAIIGAALVVYGAAGFGLTIAAQFPASMRARRNRLLLGDAAWLVAGLALVWAGQRWIG
jgi:hypothetical protein